MPDINELQLAALKRKWTQDGQGVSFYQFLTTVQRGHDCVMVQWSGIWLGIEIDGYCHS